MKKYHAAIKKDVEIHMTQPDSCGTIEQRSYKTACTIWSPFKKIYKCTERASGRHTPR